MNTELQTTNHNDAIAVSAEMTPEVFEARIKREGEMRTILKDYVRSNMKEGHHFSNSLGSTQLAKPMLLQDGTRNICSLFKLYFGEPVIDEKWLDGDHYRVRTHIALFNASGQQITSGDGICSTRETKYAYRTGQRVCPSCGVAAIYKDNKSERGGWYCWAKKDGCGAKFDANDAGIVSQQTGRVDNPDKADIENTVLKMSIKRAKTAAVCDVPMVSEIFAPEDGGAHDIKPSPKASPSVNRASAPPERPEPQETVSDALAKACQLATKLQKDHGVKFEDLKSQFLPADATKFSDMTDEQAAEAIPGLVELLNAKVANK